MTYEWDEAKRVSNLTKHGVDFADAVSGLEDEAALTMPEPTVEEEDRFVTLGADLFGRLLVVVYTWRGDSIRLISARKATKRERATYGAQK